MAEASLNFNEETLDKKSALYDLYSRLYNGMVNAGSVTPPDVTTNPPLTESGEIDIASINRTLADYSTILMKNSAYLFASSIMATAQGGGSGGSGEATFGFISREGDSMSGKLYALHGFEAGMKNQSVFVVSVDGDNNGLASIAGRLAVSGMIDVKGIVNSNEGFTIKNLSAISYSDGKLVFGSDNAGIVLKDDVTVGKSLTVGDTVITSDGIKHGNYDYYHSGNANLPSVDWTMKDGSVAGSLAVTGNSVFNSGMTVALGGNDFFAVKTVTDGDESEDRLVIYEDVHTVANKGVMYNDTYVIRNEKFEEELEGGSRVQHEEVSFAAPGMVMNLGGLSDNDSASRYISLKTGVRDYSGVTQIISKYGDGNFTNSLSAGCGNAGPKVMETYYRNVSDMGVVFYRNIALGSKTGAKIVTDDDTDKAVFSIPFTYVKDGTPVTVYDKVKLEVRQSSSMFRDQSLDHGTTSEFDTESEMFAFGKPVEASSFSIISDTYKTRLAENTLFLNDGIFIEGVDDGMRFTGNSYFSGSMSSPAFASGFAGYGWAVLKDALSGDFKATFDTLTIRKKMRVYEMEVQKISATNGSLWVSDSCSGDLVEEMA